MTWSRSHAEILATAFSQLLSRPHDGAMAYVRCLTDDVVEALARDENFTLDDWEVYRVADVSDDSTRTVTADQAVEIRETKGTPCLLLVDTGRAGAGMDGIYSSTQEINESTLFDRAGAVARDQLTRRFSSAIRANADLSIRTAKANLNGFALSNWKEFDFLASLSDGQGQPGELLYLLGLWPIKQSQDTEITRDDLGTSRVFVSHLLGNSSAGSSPTQRISSLSIISTDQRLALESFLRRVATEPLNSALDMLSRMPDLWINEIETAEASGEIIGITISSWRASTGKILAWSGLRSEIDDVETPPILSLDPNHAANGNYRKLEVRWKAEPGSLEIGSVEYRISIITDSGEELASQEVLHTGKSVEKCRFSDDDFDALDDDAVIAAKVVISVVGNDRVDTEESEDFIIRFNRSGGDDDGPTDGVGKKVRTFVDGLIELPDRDQVSEICSPEGRVKSDTNGFVTVRTPDYRSYKVYRPALIRDVEEQWVNQPDLIGRWVVRVRSSGERVGQPEFVPISDSRVPYASLNSAITASRLMAQRFARFSGVGQIYDQNSSDFSRTVRRYLSSWNTLLEEGSPDFALAHTVEVKSQSGGTIGLIVLPSHPLRVAWHVAYDNLVLFARFEEDCTVRAIRDQLSVLDGSNFPAFLPCLEDGSTFVFADTLGFHIVGMVTDQDREPKAAIALLSRALGESETSDAFPTVGGQTSLVLGKEIIKYIDSHEGSDVLHINALRPGDGMTVSRALSHVLHATDRDSAGEEETEIAERQSPAFVLELYPSDQQRGIAGRFISQARENRRSGAGALNSDDSWMIESVTRPGGINIPKLRWARKDQETPLSAAHIAVAFDTFESQVILSNDSMKNRPIPMYGLISYLERRYTSDPTPAWSSTPLMPTVGEKHPADPGHTDHLLRLQRNVARCVANRLGDSDRAPQLHTEISPDKAESMSALHESCNWVITLDRNSGIEYFDSPKDERGQYDSYVIDCVPERDDMGSLQLITSTNKVEEVRLLLDDALDQMGLTRSRSNTENLLKRLKALSGRLAMRLVTGASKSELIALALGQSNCRRPSEGDVAWPPLSSGFLIPVDDVLDLIPPLSKSEVSEDGEITEPSYGRMRPDLIYVSVNPKTGLSFRFIEVKYRSHLNNARNQGLLETIKHQTESIRREWKRWYHEETDGSIFRSLRRAKLARVLRFYADKGARHDLDQNHHAEILAEIDRMIEKGGAYTFADTDGTDLGWVFCPEHTQGTIEEVSPDGWDTRIFLFGPGPDLLPDSKLSQSALSESRNPSAGPWQSDEPVGTDASNAPTESSKTGRTDSEMVAEDRGDSDSTDSELGPGISHESDVPLVAEESAQIEEDQIASQPDPIRVTDEKTTSVGETNIVEGDEESDCAIGIGTDIYTKSEIFWPLSIKGNPHLLIAGLPGMGKTTLLLKICFEMLKSGIKPIVFSYHPDFDERLSSIIQDINFVDCDGLGFNPLQVLDRSSRSGYLDVAGSVRDIFSAIFPELGDLQLDKIRTAIRQSFKDEDETWAQPEADLSNAVEPRFGRFFELLQEESKTSRNAGLNTLMLRLDELNDYGFFSTTGTEKSLWNSETITVIRLHRQNQNERAQRAFASIVFYGLYKNMFLRGIQTRITHSVIFDEAHRAARLKLIPTMAKECRKFGISLVLASQETKDFDDSVFSAIANYLALRLNDTDAKSFVRNVARSDQEKGLIDKIKEMDKFHAVFFAEGKRNHSMIALSDV